MAGLGHKTFTRERLTSADVNGYLMDQVVLTYASASARTADLPTPSAGQVSILTDGHGIPEVFIGGAWRPVSNYIAGGATSTGFSSTATSDTRITTAALNLTPQLYSGRLYEVTYAAMVDADGPVHVEARVRAKIGATPAATDAIVAGAGSSLNTAGRPITVLATGRFGVNTSGVWHLSVFARRLSAAVQTFTLSGTGTSGVHSLDVRDCGAHISGYPLL